MLGRNIGNNFIICGLLGLVGLAGLSQLDHPIPDRVEDGQPKTISKKTSDADLLGVFKAYQADLTAGNVPDRTRCLAAEKEWKRRTADEQNAETKRMMQILMQNRVPCPTRAAYLASGEGVFYFLNKSPSP